MKKSFKIYDNFLSNLEFDQIKDVMLNDNFPWFYQDMVVSSAEENDSNSFYFTHMFYNDPVHVSNLFHIIAPIISKLNYPTLKRVKANLYTKTERLIYHTPHKDYNFPNRGAIFYVNSNNGFTIIGNKHEIRSVENRLLIFDGQMLHNSTNCTDKKVRVNININYF